MYKRKSQSKMFPFDFIIGHFGIRYLNADIFKGTKHCSQEILLSEFSESFLVVDATAYF